MRIFVRKLRRKIEENPAHPRILITVSGVGYRLTNAADSSR
ncbi:MAG: helix-turn-helix domain-containing protein [Xanthobacteraceae bacterium]